MKLCSVLDFCKVAPMTFTPTHTLPDDFTVTDFLHDACDFCTDAAENAIGLARATGSRGSTCTFSGPYGTDHSATVRRAS